MGGIEGVLGSAEAAVWGMGGRCGLLEVGARVPTFRRPCDLLCQVR
jgi:hypothetical protein